MGIVSGVVTAEHSSHYPESCSGLYYFYSVDRKRVCCRLAWHLLMTNSMAINLADTILCKNHSLALPQIVPQQYL